MNRAGTSLITIGITAFNAVSTIERAIKSARAQTWPETEIVAVDDGSTDGTAEALEALAKADARMRVLRHGKNMGVGAARNTVVEAAKGEFIAFFDDDDESAPERLQRQHDRIIRYERDTGAELVLCYTARRQVFTNGLERYEPTLGMDVTPAANGKAVVDLILLGRPTGWGRGSCAACSQMARKASYLAVGGFDPRMRRGEDTDFNLRVAMIDGHFAGISDPLVTQHIGVTSDKTVGREKAEAMKLIDRHAENFPNSVWLRFSRSWCEAKFDLLSGHVLKALVRFGHLAIRYPIKFVQRMAWSWPQRGYHAAVAGLHREANDERQSTGTNSVRKVDM